MTFERVLDLRPPFRGPAWREALVRLVPWLPTLFAVALPFGVLAFVVHPKLGALALGALTLPLFVLSPGHALLLLIAALPIDAIGSLGPPGSATVTRLLGYAVMAGWIIHVLLYRERIRLGRPGYLLLAYLAYCAVSLLWAEDLAGAIVTLRLMAQLFALYVMVVNLLTSWDALRRALDVLLAATVGVAFFVFWQLPRFGGVERATLKFGEEAFNPNQLAVSLVLPVFAGLLLQRRGIGRWRALAIVPLVIAALVTGSRGASVAILMASAVLVAGRPRALVELALGSVVIGLVAVSFLPKEKLAAIGSRYDRVAEDRGSGRLDIWKVGVEMIEDQPLRGVGLAGFQPAFYRYMTGVALDPRWARESRNRYGNRGAHNVYLQTLAELGVMGAALLLSAIAAHGYSVWRQYRYAQRTRDRDAAAISLSVACILAVLLTLCLSGDILTTKSAWVVLGFAQAVALVGMEEASRRRAASAAWSGAALGRDDGAARMVA